ncbi:hypothetical protein TNCV_2045001 [Trichonephila clavipes]|nr:hypothetical protein TNCV_2045001 [Trichonephila clavipes]
MQDRFKSLLNKCETKENRVALTREKLLTLTAELYDYKITFLAETIIYGNVSCYFKSNEERKVVDRRQADTEVSVKVKKIEDPNVIIGGAEGTVNCQVIYSQFGLAIHQNDHQARRRFVEWAQNEIAVVPDFHKRILFSDEAHFWLNGYVNKQN